MQRFTRLGTVLLVAAAATYAVPVPTVQAASDHGAVQVITDWNRALVDALEVGPTPPPPAMRAGAIVQAAVFDAVNGITRQYRPLHVSAAAPHGASVPAAAAAAAHASLLALFPAQKAALDARLTETLARLGHRGSSVSVSRGLAWGTAVAEAILGWRSTDGFTAQLPPYVSSPVPGRWQPTPPAFAPPAFRQFATMTPFAIERPDQFLPSPPPALTGARYAQDFAEVRDIGSATSPVRTAFDTQTAQFWNSDVPVALWDRVAADLIDGSSLSATQAARLLAQANVAMADSVISIWNAKAFYDTWRPITAIRNADLDGNTATTADPTWSPLLVTPAFQEYPSGHSGVSASAAAVLADEFGPSTAFTMTSANLPGVERSYRSFGQAVAQVSDARVLAGIHFRFACEAAVIMGRAIAGSVEATVMAPRHHDG